MVKGQQVYLIDVAFGEVRPSPWREAVDLANMMLILALHSSPEHVLERAQLLFTDDELAEAFAVARGITLPSQLRRQLRDDSRSLLEDYRALLPETPQVKIQRWSWRRLLLTIGVALASAVVVAIVLGNLDENRTDMRRTLALGLAVMALAAAGCSDRRDDPRQAHLPGRPRPRRPVRSRRRAGSVLRGPSGRLDVSSSYIGNKGTTLKLDSDRAGFGAATFSYADQCDVSGLGRLPSEQDDVEVYEEIDQLAGGLESTRYFVFDRGCVTARFDFDGFGDKEYAEDLLDSMLLISREDLNERSAAAERRLRGLMPGSGRPSHPVPRHIARSRRSPAAWSCSPPPHVGVEGGPCPPARNGSIAPSTEPTTRSTCPSGP